MMTDDDRWWSMMIDDDRWWSMMIDDDRWWSMMIDDDRWWWTFFFFRLEWEHIWCTRIKLSKVWLAFVLYRLVGTEFEAIDYSQSSILCSNARHDEAILSLRFALCQSSLPALRSIWSIPSAAEDRCAVTVQQLSCTSLEPAKLLGALEHQDQIPISWGPHSYPLVN